MMNVGLPKHPGHGVVVRWLQKGQHFLHLIAWDLIDPEHQKVIMQNQDIRVNTEE